MASTVATSKGGQASNLIGSRKMPSVANDGRRVVDALTPSTPPRSRGGSAGTDQQTAPKIPVQPSPFPRVPKKERNPKR